MQQIFIKQKYSLFFFSTSVKDYNPNTILDLYREIDPNWNTNPLIPSICLARHGWLCFTSKGWLHMAYNAGEKTHEEIIGFLCTLIQDLPRTELSRGTPRIGYYLTNPSETGRFKNGKLVKKPWKKVSMNFSNTRFK